jgi:hypothetical protein
MNEQFKLPGIDWGADVTGEQNLEDQRISMAYQLGHLTFAELILIGTYIPGTSEAVDEEIELRRYQIEEVLDGSGRVSLSELSANKPYPKAVNIPATRLGDPEE